MLAIPDDVAPQIDICLFGGMPSKVSIKAICTVNSACIWQRCSGSLLKYSVAAEARGSATFHQREFVEALLVCLDQVCRRKQPRKPNWIEKWKSNLNACSRLDTTRRYAPANVHKFRILPNSKSSKPFYGWRRLCNCANFERLEIQRNPDRKREGGGRAQGNSQSSESLSKGRA